MKITKAISCLLASAMFSATLVMPKLAFADTLDNSNVGEIVEFGKYHDTPIQYVIGGMRDVDSDGQDELFLYSKEIISYKAYSTNGKADWRKSTLRTWLNSDDTVVDYGTETPPSYATQPGFMSWFTNKELGVMVPVTQKTMINKNLGPDGGTASVSWKDRWPECYTANADVIDTAYYVETTDTVFIPSIKDMYDYSMALNDAMATHNSTVVALSGDSVIAGKEKEIAVRDGHANEQNTNDITKKIRYWTPTNSISVSWTYSVLGIRPCFYIKSGLDYTGEGTTESPYKLVFPVAEEEVFGRVLEAINTGNRDSLLKILTNDPDFAAEYNSLSGKGLMIEEMDENGIYEAVADGLIAQKPVSGYTEDNIKGIFNKIVVSTMYDCATAENKYMIIENPEYRVVLGITSVKQGVAYNLVKNGPNKNELFDGISASELSQKLEEKIILMAVNEAADASEMCDIVEENAELIGIAFPDKYSHFSPEDIEKLYTEMLGITYFDYDDIKSQFEVGYEVVISSVVYVLGSSNVGGIVEFGKYHGIPIQYKIGGMRDVDGDGQEELFLYSKDILSYKEYSANGLADWRKSTLRTWLNSLDVNVAYDEGNIPSYASQPGFMSWFTDRELSVMVPVTQKTLIHETLSPDGGSNAIGWTDKWPGCYTDAVGDRNINTAYHVLTTDTVFIPSITDMYDYSMTLDATMAAANNDVIAATGETKIAEVAVRDGQNADKIRYWYPINCISVSGTDSKLGIRPCFYIKSGVAYTGDGTAASPYKLVIPEYVSDIALYVNNTEAEWQNAAAEAKVTLSDNFTSQPVTVYAIRYEKNEDTLVAADIKWVSKTAVAGEAISVPVEISNADSSYMKVFVTDSNNKSLCKAEVFGTYQDTTLSSDVQADAKFYVDEPTVENGIVTISGLERNRAYSTVTVIAKRGEEVLYADQKKVDNNGFAFRFDGTNSFESGVITTAGGWYTLTVTSDYSDTVLTKQIGISGEAVYTGVLQILNDGDRDTLAKILKKDDAFVLEYNSLLGKGLFLDVIESNNSYETVADGLISNKPDGGYTEENIKDIFNKIAVGVCFDAADVENKYLIIENEEYRKLLGIESVKQGIAYNAVKNGTQKNSLFAGISAVELAGKLEERIVIMAANSAQNASDMRSIVEENAGVIGITLPGDYATLSSLNLKKLYDAMLGTTYTSFAGIKGLFNSSYQSVKNSMNTTSSGGGGGGGGSSSGKGSSSGGTSIAAPLSKPESLPVNDPGTTKPQATQKPEVKSGFADVEGLSWGKNEINYLAEKGIISGITEDRFMPNENITREQFCRLIAVAYGIENTGDVPFEDFKAGEWYADAVVSLYAGGFISGISETEFGVGKKISRQDMAVILYRVMEDKLESENNGKEFADMDSVKEYAKDAVNAMSASGIISGYDDNSFRGENAVTRREAAVMLYRALNLGE